MYQVPPPKEPSGCLQTLVISRMIFQILLIPIALILGAIFAVLLMLYAFSVSPFLALGVLIMAGALLGLAAKWEAKRIERDMSRDD